MYLAKLETFAKNRCFEELFGPIDESLGFLSARKASIDL